MENNTDLTASHRRSQSDAGGLLDVAGALQDAPQAPGHLRSVSLGSSASLFLQSLKLQDPAALQHSLQATEDQLALPDQHTPYAECSAVDTHAACAGKAAAAAVQDMSAGQSARSKRTHRSSNGRPSKDAMQLDGAVPEQLSHGFTPLPAVVENSPLDDSERDWDSDSDREGYGPNRRGSRAGGRRGGCNGRSESELMLLDPKRVKRILANRESAARSKERRMNYTMELEGKLHDLSLQADKLSSQLHTLSKQEGKLRASKADLEQQVHSMQQQLAQVVSDNHALMGTLFELQAALGLPQALPDCVMPAGMQGAAADACYQQCWQGYPEQQYPDSAQAAGAKQRKLRRQSRQQQDKQHQLPQALHAWNGSDSLPGAAAPDLSDPAAAAAAPVAELPVRPVRSVLAAAAGAAGQAAGQMQMEASAAAAGAAGAHAGSAANVAAPHAVVTTGPPSNRGGSGVPPPLQVSPRQHQWHTGLGGSSSNTTPSVTPQPHTAGASGQLPSPAAAFAPAAATGLAPSSAAAAAGDAASILLLRQLPPPGADAVMGDAEDDIAMLGAFLEEDDAVNAGAAAGAVTCSTAAPVGVHSHQDAAAAAAAVASLAERAASTAAADAWATSNAGGSLPGHCSPQVSAAVPAAVARTFMFRSSPALSDRAGGDVLWDDVSSGSAGGSLTHSHTPNLTLNSGRCGAEGLTGVSPAYAAAAGWQQPHHQQQQQHHHIAGRIAVVSPAAAGGNFVPPAPITTAQVSPTTPVSGRVPTPGSEGQVGSMYAAAGIAAYPADPMQVNPVQQQQVGVNFVMGANPAANWRGGRHVRSASTGCVSGLGWHGYDQFVLPTSSELMLQEQQQQQQGASMLATQQQHHHHHHQQQQLEDRHARIRGHGSVVTTVTGLPPIHAHVSMPEATLTSYAAASGIKAAAILGQDSVADGPDLGQGPWQRHRRSHSHAAAFMGQCQLQQQAQACGPVATQHGVPVKPELQ